MTNLGPSASYQRVRATFDQLVDVPETQRADAFDAARLSEEERTLVRQLLAGHAKRRLFVRSAADWANQLDGDDYIEAMIGRHVGACEIVRFVGRGGSSVVYYARRRVADTQQDVALKLLNSGLLSSEAHRRFRREQAILSRLTHPNIARLIDAGISDSGIPFIAMEYVDGTDIVSYASQRSLDLRTRIGLLADVCRAVDAAHTALVVHRDLKPSNVLVTNDGVVKVLDFGIAKLIDDDAVETATRHVALTPAYAAPEQFSPGPAATSMDVYSLGVLASELILGGRLGTDASLPADESSQTWQKWRRIDTDLSHILRAALASEPGRRYSSAGHMADDLIRYVNREPLQIVPVSRWYRTIKFVSRHRTAMFAVAVVCLAVLGATIGIAYQWRNAQQQATLAQQQAARAGEIRDFLVSIFEAGNAEMPLDKQPSVENIVVDAGQRLRVDEKLSGPLRIDLMLTLADVASSIGAHDRSDGLLDEVDRLSSTAGVDQNDISLQVKVRRVGNLLSQTTTKGAQALEILEPLLPALQSRNDEIGLEGLLDYADAQELVGRRDDAQRFIQPIIEKYRTSKKPDLALKALGTPLHIAVGAQRYAEAADYARTTETYWREHGSPQNPAAMDMWGDIAIAKEGVGDIDGAEQAYRQAIGIGDRIFSHPNNRAASIIEIFGTFLIVQSRIDEAEAPLKRALQMEQSIYGEDDPRTAQAVYGMARLYGARGDFPEAIRWMTRCIDLAKRDGPSVRLARSLAARGKFEMQSGNLADADRDIHEALDVQKSITGENAPGYAWVLEVLADLQLREHRYEEALRTTDRILSITGPANGGMLQNVLATKFKHAKALAALEREQEALGELQDIEAAYAHVAPKSNIRFDIAALKAVVLAGMSRASEAREAARAALELQPVKVSDAALLDRLRALASDTSAVTTKHR